MKTITTVLLGLLISTFNANANGLSINLDDLNGFTFNAPNPLFIKKEESPWPGATIKHKSIHKKTVELEFTDFKVTTLGYGSRTPKVISLDLANHTVLDHRNIGESGPCLSGAMQLGEMFSPKLPAREMVEIELRNKFAINEEKGVCQVTLEEIVTTHIDGKKFSHHLSKDMGFRLIDDCK